jgi:xanthine/uracil permease
MVIDVAFLIVIVLFLFMIVYGRQYYSEYPFLMGLIASFIASVTVNKLILTDIQQCAIQHDTP